jgi:diguanylate cyclase (GGDEF)-like protein
LPPTSPVPSPSQSATPHQTGRLTDPALASIGALFGRSPFATRAGLLNNAEIIVWQSSRRLLIALVVGLIAVTLRLTRIVAGPVWPILVIVPAYIAIVALITVAVERKHEVSRAALVAIALVDVAAIFVTVGFVTSPAFYPRALLLALLALQFTQMFFGRSSALTVITASTIGYAALVLSAWERGMNVAWVEEGWMLALYLFVALNGMALQASASRRLTVLVDLFAAAQRGDFSRAFVEEADVQPDGITLLGRAYNHLRSELANLVMSDTLTGCLNRRGLDHAVQQAIRVAVRRGGEIALLAIDIDHFKAINDTAGHLAGDAVLRELSELLSHSSRAGDVVARVGGEEFVVLLPGADNEQAGVVAERVMTTVRNHAFRTTRGRLKVTVSVGIACEQVTDAHVGAALRARADEALYLAKRLGRNRVVMWAPGIRSNATPPWSSFVQRVSAPTR